MRSGKCSGKLKFCAARKIPAPTHTVPMVKNVIERAGKRSDMRAPATGNAATSNRTKLKRQAGDSSSQCAATNNKTPAHNKTPPSAKASSTGQRRRSLDICDCSKARIRAAVPASKTPDESQRSSCFSKEVATRCLLLYLGYIMPERALSLTQTRHVCKRQGVAREATQGVRFSSPTPTPPS